MSDNKYSINQTDIWVRYVWWSVRSEAEEADELSFLLHFLLLYSLSLFIPPTQLDLLAA